MTVPIPSRVTSIAAAQFDVLNARAGALRAQGHDVISLGQALPGFGPPAEAIAALREALGTPDTHVYSADAGRKGLREALCHRLRTAQDVDVNPSEVIVTAGGNQAFMLALMTLVDAGDEVLLPSPYFVNHEMAVRAIGARPREVPLHEEQGFALRWKDLDSHLTKQTRAVVVCAPSNPTGALVKPAELARIARELAVRNVLLLADETYARFVYEGEFRSAASLPDWRENVVTVSTFSKSFGMTGWRVGYMLASRAVCEQAIKIQDAMIICAPVPAQVGVEAALREAWDYPHDFARGLAARRRELADAVRAIPRLHWAPTGGGFFAFVRVEGCTDSAQLAEELLEQAHVVVIPGTTFGSAGEGFIRLSYSAVEAGALREALERLRRFFQSA